MKTIKDFLTQADWRQAAHQTGVAISDAVIVALQEELKDLGIDAEQHEIDHIACIAAKETRQLVKKYLVPKTYID